MELMDLSGAEVQLLQKIINSAMGDTVSGWDANQGVRAMQVEPVVRALMEHQPFEIGDSWGCTCTKKGLYVSKTHVLVTHIKPIVEKAATQKMRDILERSGMDYDVIMQSDKIFGKEAEKKPANGGMIYPSEHSVLRQRQAAMRPRYCEHGNDINQPCRQCP